jgi:hypothetical protein
VAVALTVLLSGLAGARWYPEQPKSTAPLMQMRSPIPAGMRQLMQARPTSQAPTEATLAIPDSVTGELLSAQGRPLSVLAPAGRVAPLIALTGDPGRGLLLTCGSDGVLRCYSSSLQPLGARRLSRPACQMALDGRRGLLYATVASPGSFSLGLLGDPERGGRDIHVYDVKGLLEGPPDPGGELKPLHSLSVGGQVHALLLSGDGGSLYYLAETLREAHIGRIATHPWSHRLLLSQRKGGMLALAQVPGADHFAGLVGGRLFFLDPKTGSMRDTVNVPGAIGAFAPGPNGQVFLVERRNGTHLLVVDVKRRSVRARLSLPLVGRVYACSAWGSRLYLGSSAVLDGQVVALDVAGTPRPVGLAHRDRDRLIRGGLFLSPDGKLLVTGNGHVYHAPL